MTSLRLPGKPSSDDRFGFSALVAQSPARVDVRGIDEVQPELECLVELAKGVRFRQRPSIDVPADADDRDFRSVGSKFSLFHYDSPLLLRWCVASLTRNDLCGLAMLQQPRASLRSTASN
jgi:hypothetical protein